MTSGACHLFGGRISSRTFGSKFEQDSDFGSRFYIFEVVFEKNGHFTINSRETFNFGDQSLRFFAKTYGIYWEFLREGDAGFYTRNVFATLGKLVLKVVPHFSGFCQLHKRKGWGLHTYDISGACHLLGVKFRAELLGRNLSKIQILGVDPTLLRSFLRKTDILRSILGKLLILGINLWDSLQKPMEFTDLQPKFQGVFCLLLSWT